MARRGGRRWCAATAAATAATSSTSGMATLFIGVAASSAFQHAHRRAAAAGPERLDRRLRRPLRQAGRPDRDPRRARSSASSSAPSSCVSRKDGKRRAHAPADPRLLPRQRAVRPGQRDVRRRVDQRGADGGRPAPRRLVGRPARAGPDPRADEVLRRGAAQDGHRRASTTATTRRWSSAPASRTSSSSYSSGSPAATFRLIVSPIVAWIWIGGIIVFGGGLVALWPAPDAARRRSAGALQGARGAGARPGLARAIA